MGNHLTQWLLRHAAPLGAGRALTGQGGIQISIGGGGYGKSPHTVGVAGPRPHRYKQGWHIGRRQLTVARESRDTRLMANYSVLISRFASGGDRGLLATLTQTTGGQPAMNVQHYMLACILLLVVSHTCVRLW